MSDLARHGCTVVVIVHDLDRDKETHRHRDEKALRARLEAIPKPHGVKRHICIPVQEIEAWFWSDPKIVTKVGRGTGKAHPNPHNIIDPKEELVRLSRDAGRRPRYSTNDNAKFAKELDIELCAQRCPSFDALRKFVLKAF